MLSRFLAAFASAAMLFGADVNPAVHVDQVGYAPFTPKIAVIAAALPAASFVVRRLADDQAVLSGSLSEARSDSLSGDTVQLADFSALQAAGDYYLDIPGVGRSYAFTIGHDVFSRAFYLAMRGFYGQRCATTVDLSPDFPGYQHAPCHRTGGYHASSGKSGTAPSVGGWHDAGDYGRYVVNSGISTGTLLWAWELYGDRIGATSLHIPESGNGVPDMLNEIRWNLDWMLSMQDADGGVWHKQTSASFPGFVMPDADSLPSLVVGTGRAPYKSSCATGDFAAVMAIASRAFAPFDAAYAARTLDAARSAWTWLGSNPNVTFANPAGVSTGEYGDNNCADERFWAAGELWRTTRESAYSDYFTSHYVEFTGAISATNPPGWPSVGAMGLWTYALASGSSRDAGIAGRIQTLTFQAADAIVDRMSASAYRISMRMGDYYWGSNSVAANYSLQLLIAHTLGGDSRYRDAAFENLHYLLGRNAFSVSWVTGIGSNPFRHPHHRPSGADRNPEPWPGLLSGGPNPNREDTTMQAIPSRPPMRMWVDDQNAYSANEIAINWNAPLVFVLAAALPDPPALSRTRRR